jgi:anthranilate synthase component 1
VSFARFRELARASSLVPVWRDCLLDTDTAVSAFAKLRRGPFSFLLESAPAGGETWSRYTFIGAAARGAWRLRDGVVEDWTADRGWHGRRTPDDPLADLRERVAADRPVDAPELGAFWGGAVGYFAYDVVRHLEHLPSPPPRWRDAPDALFVLTRSVVIVDTLRAQARVVVAVPIPAGATDATLRAVYDEAGGDIDDEIRRLRAPSSLTPIELEPPAVDVSGRSSLSRDEFLRRVERIREDIAAGECFQVLLSRRIETTLDFDTLTLYRALRALNPSPYMYHLAMDGVELIGSSPELLVRVDGGRVTVRPIAGTRPRGITPAHDAALAAELVADEKERAEHVMLVDLGRNDIGRIARYGSVRVSELMNVERYSHVLHLVSQVEGELPEGTSAIDAFKATFPAGTMTGAPKVRAMEIIDELEPERRGPYAGAVGYVAYGDRRMDLAITIRTCVVTDGVVSVQAGAGIVADSVPAREWEETENKAMALLTAIARARACSRR